MTCKGVTFRLAKGSHLDSRAQQISAVSGVKVTFVDKNGEEYSPEEYRKEFMSADPFNPPDLSE